MTGDPRLPEGMIREAVEETLGEADISEVEYDDDIPVGPGGEQYRVFGLVGRRVVRMDFIRPKDEEYFRESTESFRTTIYGRSFSASGAGRPL